MVDGSRGSQTQTPPSTKQTSQQTTAAAAAAAAAPPEAEKLSFFKSFFDTKAKPLAAEDAAASEPPAPSTPSTRRSRFEPLTKRSEVTAHTAHTASTMWANTADHVQLAVTETNAIGVDAAQIMNDTVSRVATRGGGGGAVAYVLKVGVLLCVLAYTFSIDTVRCKCADSPRKLLVQCTASVVLVMLLAVLVYPRLYRTVPILKMLMMVTTLLLVYGMVTYFPVIDNKACPCAEVTWQRYVAEYSVYAVLLLFVLALVGVRMP
jgi:hypothetical protein